MATAKAGAAEGTASLEKALDVLDAIGSAPAGLSQAELASQLALPRTTLYRLLGTLVQRGLVRRDPLRRVYGLGMRCFEYAKSAYAMPDLVAAAGAELRTLRDITGETVYLAARDGHDVVALERCLGAHSQRSNSSLGQRKPLHCTSQGKAILAALPAEERDALVREMPLTAVTPRSITDRRRLQAELRLTAARGWSIDDEEIVPGVRCCGAAVVDSAGHVRGAISVAGPVYRLTMERIELLGPEVAEVARRIGAQLSAASPARAAGEAQVVPGEWAFDGQWPLWHQGRLWWADTLAPAVHAATPQQDSIAARADAPLQALLLSGGELLARWADAWHRVGAQGEAEPAAAALTQGLRGRFTAACNDPAGQPWLCSADGERWRVAGLGAREGFGLAEPASAMAWSPDGDTLYVAAAASGTVWAARPGSPGGVLRRLATLPKGSGLIAGLAVDAEGGVWTALRGGWGVVRLQDDGTLDRMVALPVPCPTGVALGGADGRTLFITSARDTIGREALDAAPLSGRLFVLST